MVLVVADEALLPTVMGAASMCKKDDILLPSNLVLKYMCARRSADVMLLMSCYAHNRYIIASEQYPSSAIASGFQWERSNSIAMVLEAVSTRGMVEEVIR